MSQPQPRAPYAFAVGGVVAAIVLWFIMGPLSLIIDLGLGLWLASRSLGGEFRESPLASLDRVWTYVRGVHADAFHDPTGAGPTPSNPRPTVAAAVGKHEHARVLAAAVIAPIVTGLLAACAAGLSHSSQAEVCSAYEDFVATDQASKSAAASLSGTGSDDEWFASAQHLADVAADAGGLGNGEVASAGAQLQTTLKGGGGIIIAVSPAAVYKAASPIAFTCSGSD